MMAAGILWMATFWAAVIGSAVWAVVRLTSSNHPDGATARSIRDERYVRGEVDDEHRRLRSAIGTWLERTGPDL